MNERIERLRTIALNNPPRLLRHMIDYCEGWLNHAHEYRLPIRHALAHAHMLSSARPIIDVDELIVGRPDIAPLTDDEKQRYDMIKQYVLPAMPNIAGQGSHMAIDFEELLSLGIEGILARIEAKRAELSDFNLEKIEFYSACTICLNGVLAYAAHHGLTHVPAKPARNFREALQSVWFVNMCLNMHYGTEHGALFQLGRPDRYLLPYFEKDLSDGTITHEFAQELIDCACVLFNQCVPRGLAVGFMVGGSDAHGRDTCNDLTRLFIESIGHTRMIYPGIGLCVTKDTPREILRRSLELLAEGNTHPALFNDAVIIAGLIARGVPNDEACEYVHSTCVEITPCASSNVWVASPYINLAQILLDCLKIDYLTFDALKIAVKNRLNAVVRNSVLEQNSMQISRMSGAGNPLNSCFVNDCIEKGVDVEKGGARYNFIMPSFVGLSNLADSLTAIKCLVFEKDALTLAHLRNALENDYQGNESLRQMLLTRAPKYGNDDTNADEIVSELSQWIADSVAPYRTPMDATYAPSLFCWVMHEQLGSQTGATPDGRRAGFPLGDGSGPAQGRELFGPTAAALSATKWDHTPFIGGIAVNMKFSRSLMTGTGIDKMCALVNTFIARGGFELQINCVDADTLKKAQAQPELYADLVVRVGGYSDYFAKLSPNMQAEVIMRTEYEG